MFLFIKTCINGRFIRVFICAIDFPAAINKRIDCPIADAIANCFIEMVITILIVNIIIIRCIVLTGNVGCIKSSDVLYLLVMFEVFKVQMHCTYW